MTEKQKCLKNCSLDIISDDPELRGISDFNSLRSHPRFKARLQYEPGSLELIEEIIAEYRYPALIQCAFGHWHQHGFIAVMLDGVITQLGHACSSKGPFRDDFIRRKNEFKAERERRGLAKALETLDHDVERFKAHSCRTDPQSTLALYLRLLSFQHELPRDLQYYLTHMARAGTNELVAVRQADRRERQLQAVSGDTRASSLKSEVVCSLAGAECLQSYFNVRHLIADCWPRISRLRDSPKFSTTAERSKVNDDLNRLRSNNVRLQRARELLESFLKLDNLCQLERAIDGKGSKKLVRRIAKSYAINDMDKAA